MGRVAAAVEETLSDGAAVAGAVGFEGGGIASCIAEVREEWDVDEWAWEIGHVRRERGVRHDVCLELR